MRHSEKIEEIMDSVKRTTEENPKGRGQFTKPCEMPDENDYSCLGCEYFDECQLSEVVNIKAELKLEDDY